MRTGPHLSGAIAIWVCVRERELLCRLGKGRVQEGLWEGGSGSGSRSWNVEEKAGGVPPVLNTDPSPPLDRPLGWNHETQRKKRAFGKLFSFEARAARSTYLL